MRALGAATTQVVSSGNIAQRVRVSVKDSGGTFRDLTTYPGENLVDSVSWNDNNDSTGATASITLLREVEKLSLAPLMTASPLNRGFNPAASSAALLAVGRMIKIETSTDGMDATPANWIEVFRGYIDVLNTGAAETVTLECRDESALLMDTFIETERAYCLFTYGGTTRGARIWTPSTAYVSGEFVVPTDGRRAASAYAYEVTTGGTSHTVEPTTWPNAGTATTGGGTAVFTYRADIANTGYSVESVMQRILTENGLSVTLYTPTPPLWDIKAFIQQREPVYEAIRALAQQIGWDVRYKWDSGTAAFRLTLFEPDRAKVAVDYTFSAADYENVSNLTTDISGIRNVVRVIYSDPADLWPDKTPKRKTVEVTDSTSITTYGRRFMEIAEADTSNIDTSSEAGDMANGALADLKDPEAVQEIELTYGFPWIELGDLYTFTANGRHYAADQSWAVVGWSHQAQDGNIRTSMTTRGQPTLGFGRWHNKEARPSKGLSPHALSLMQTPAGTSLTATATVGGTMLEITGQPASASYPYEREFHVSTTTGFTPSASTLVATVNSDQALVTDLVPGVTYYAKSVERFRNAERLVRTEPGTQVSFTAGRASAAHLNMSVGWGRIPLNGSFETQFDAAAPPDHWEMTAGTWVTDIDRVTGTGAITGDAYIHVKTGNTQRTLESEGFIEVISTHAYWFSAFAKGISGSGDLFIAVRWYLGDFSYDSQTAHTKSAADLVWTEPQGAIFPPSGAKFAKIAIYKDDPTTAGAWHVDSVKLVDIGYDWIEPSLGNSWVNVDASIYNAVAYRRDANGRVYLKGLMKDGTGSPAFTLPNEYAPIRKHLFSVVANNAFGRVDVEVDGDVVLVSGSNAFVSLDGISFDTWE